MRVLLVLPTIQDVLWAEEEMLARDIPHELLPTPTHISTDCGMVVAVEESNLSSVQALLKELNVEVVSMHMDKSR